MTNNIDGNEMYELAKTLWPINRSITGEGVRKTLKLIKNQIPILKIHEVASGTKVFDWEVPLEWSINEAYILDSSGNKILDFKDNNLHVVSYSVPVDKVISLSELQKHLYSLPNQENAIPYVTSYYKKRWGFCMSESQRKKLKKGSYKVFIDSKFFEGSLTYAELLIPGLSKEEIFFSSYVCHPSMANNELSGPVVLTQIIKWLMSLRGLRYSYRLIFIPETIGSITYLSKNIKKMKENIIAGCNVTCVGDEREYSFISSRNGDSLADKHLLHILKHYEPSFKKYSFLDRGSDERQYCSPGVDLPVVTFCRSKFSEYPEYHTSLDDLNLISPQGLTDSFNVLKHFINSFENNQKINYTTLCEPNLGKRGLYPTLGVKDNDDISTKRLNFLAYSDGSTLLKIAEKIGVPIWDLYIIRDELLKNNLIRVS
jgi:aminopeptidase-like protein